MGRAAGDLGSVGRVSAVPYEPDWLAEWVGASCAAQGVPIKVTDPGVLSQVGVLLGVGAGSTRAHGAPAPSTRGPAPPSQSPHRLHPLGVQPPGTGDARGDHGMVQHGREDGGLPFQTQGRPAVA